MRTNEFIAESEPWALAKDPANADRLTQVLFDAAEALRVAAVLLAPVMPVRRVEILRRVGEPRRPRELRLDRDAAWKGDFARQTERGPSLWPRLEAKETSAEQTFRTSSPSRPSDDTRAEPWRFRHVGRRPSDPPPLRRPAARQRPARSAADCRRAAAAASAAPARRWRIR